MSDLERLLKAIEDDEEWNPSDEIDKDKLREMSFLEHLLSCDKE